MGPVDLFRGKLEKIDSMEAMFTLNDAGTIVSCNRNFVVPLFGYITEELVNQSISMLIPKIFEASSKTLSDLSSSTSAKEFLSSDRDDSNDEPKPKKIKTDGDHASGCPVAHNAKSFSLKDEIPPELPQDEEDLHGHPVVLAEEHIKDQSVSWKRTGVHFRDVLHKDGSSFPVLLEIYPFPSMSTTLYSVRLRRIQTQPMDQASAKSIGEYWIAKTIGHGTYGKVKMGIHKQSKLQVAIKILSKKELGPLETERARREIDIMKQLKHPNIAELYEIVELEDSINLVMEYGGRTLLSYVMECRGLSENEARKFFRMMVSAIDYCHKRNIIHRDIKHQNILLNAQGEIKIIDFGLSNFKEEGKLRATFCGTPAYAAPEMVLFALDKNCLLIAFCCT